MGTNPTGGKEEGELRHKTDSVNKTKQSVSQKGVKCL